MKFIREKFSKRFLMPLKMEKFYRNSHEKSKEKKKNIRKIEATTQVSVVVSNGFKKSKKIL